MTAFDPKRTLKAFTRAQYQAESDQASVAAKSQKVCERSTWPYAADKSSTARS